MNDPAGIKTRREALNLSQERLARLANCSVAAVRIIEGGWEPVGGVSKVSGRIERALQREEGKAKA